MFNSHVIFKSFQDFDWDENTQGLILSAFYWTYWISELPGGLLAQRFGAKKIFGGSVFCAALLNLALPPASKLSFWTASLVRALQGLVLVTGLFLISVIIGTPYSD